MKGSVKQRHGPGILAEHNVPARQGDRTRAKLAGDGFYLFVLYFSEGSVINH